MVAAEEDGIEGKEKKVMRVPERSLLPILEHDFMLYVPVDSVAHSFI